MQYRTGLYKFRNAEQVISYLLTTQGRGVNAGPRIELKCNRDVGMFEWTAPMIVFRKTSPIQSVQSHTTAALVYWEFKWSKSSARRFHVFLNVLTFGRGSVGGKEDRRSIEKRMVCKDFVQVMSCMNNRRE